MRDFEIPAKLTPPQPSGLYTRTRLFAILDESHKHNRAVWIDAPGGAGKTSLATSYGHSRGLNILWYQVDTGDLDVASLFYYLAVATQKAAPQYPNALPALRSEFLADIATFTRHFFRELYNRLPKQSLIVFDNCELVAEDSHWQIILRTAITELPDHISLMVLSRTAPPPNLARLQMSKKLDQLDWAMLRLTPEENAAICELHQSRALTTQELTQLYEKTEGWVAGLTLLLERHNDNFQQALAVKQPLLFDFFAGELFEQATQSEQEFMLKTALLHQVTVETAGQLSGQDNAATILRDFTRRNFFTVRHSGRKEDSYSYHPLFREFLLARIERNTTPEELHQLRNQAANIIEHEGDVDQALDLHQTNRNWAEMERLIFLHAPGLSRQGRTKRLVRWLESVPKDHLDRSPWLLYWLGFSNLTANPGGAFAPLDQAYRLFEQHENATGLYTAWSTIVESIIYAWSTFHHLIPWIERFDRIVTRLPVPDDQALADEITCTRFLALMYAKPQHPDMVDCGDKVGNILMGTANAGLCARIAPHYLMYQMWWLADLHKAKVGLQALEAFRQETTFPLAQIAWHAGSAGYYWMKAQKAECQEAVDQGLALADATGAHAWDVFLAAQGAAVNLWSSEVDMATADRYLQRMECQIDPERLLDRFLYHWLLAFRHYHLNELPIALEHVVLARHFIERGGWVYLTPTVYMDQARVLHYLGKTDEAQQLLRSAFDLNELPYSSPPRDYFKYITQAEISLAAGREDEALEALTQGLALAHRQGFESHSWWHAPTMARLYAFALNHKIETDYVQAMIRKHQLSPPEDIACPASWPLPVHLHTLGELRILVEGEPLRFTGKSQQKLLDLLKALIVYGKRGIKQETLADLLWPDTDGDAIKSTVNATVHRLRKMLKHRDAVLVQNRRIYLNPRCCWVDAWSLEESLEWHKAAPAPLEPILDHISGPFLAGDTEPHILFYRDQLSAKLTQLLNTRHKELSRLENPSALVSLCEQALTLDPTLEPFYHHLVRAYAANGQTAEAMRSYQRYQRFLQTHPETKPSTDIQMLYNELTK